MSRTHAHAPAAVELARVTDPTILDTWHTHWAPGVGPVTCPDPRARCASYVPRWASTQPWTRRGTAVFQRSSVVRDRLREAAKAYRAGANLDDVQMPDPVTYCLCEHCGVGRW